MSDTPAPSPHSNRARGTVEADFVRVGSRTEVVGPFETGGYRLRLPRSRGSACEAVMVNTGGGMAGGDRLRYRFSAATGAAVTLTTTAAEKIYRGREADGGEGATCLEVDLALSPGAALDWLPQETILFDGARLHRGLTVDMAEDADLLMAEMLVFGRLAMDERIVAGSLHDRWRVRRGGRLIMAEDLAIGGDMAGLLDRAALGAGARAAATLLLASPAAERLLDGTRALLHRHGHVAAGASAWNGCLVLRALSPSPERLRATLVTVLTGLRGRALPRLWG